MHPNSTLHMLKQSTFTHLHKDAKEQSNFDEQRVKSVSGEGMWPDRPTVMTWRLVNTRVEEVFSLSSPGRGRRALELEQLSGLVRASVARGDTPVEVEEKYEKRAKRVLKKPKDNCKDLSLPRRCDDVECVHHLLKRARTCPALLGSIEVWLRKRCSGARGEDCGPMLNVLGALGHVAAQGVLARHLASEATQLDFLPRSGVLALGTIESPTDELVQTLATLVPNGSPRRATHKRRNFLLAVSAVAGTALQRGPHTRETQHALSNVSHAIIGHHDAMLEAEEWWVALHEQARAIAHDHWKNMPHHSREGWVQHHHQLKRQALEWVWESGDWNGHVDAAVEGLQHEWLARLDAYDADEEPEHVASLIASIRAIGNLRHLHAHHLKRVHQALKHRTPQVKQAAAETLRDVAHPSSEKPLLELLYDETDRHVRRAAMRTMHGFEEMGDEAINTLLSEWQQRRADVRGHGCIAACVRSVCNPHAHREGCRNKCKQQCDDDHKNHNLLSTLLQKHTTGRRLYRTDEHDERFSDETRTSPEARWSVVPRGVSESSLRGRRLFDWDNINFDEFSLTFIDLRIKLPGGLDMHEEMGMKVDRVAFFGIKIDVVIDNRGWIRVGLFGGGFGVHFVDEGSANFIPGFGAFELFYGGFRFKFDATYRNNFAEGFAKGLRAVTSIADQLLATLESLLKMVKDKLKYLICQLQLVDQKLLMFLQRMPTDTGMLLEGGSFAVVKQYASMVLGTVTNLEATLLNVTTSPGIKTMISVAFKVKQMYDKATKFLDDNKVRARPPPRLLLAPSLLACSFTAPCTPRPPPLCHTHQLLCCLLALALRCLTASSSLPTPPTPPSRAPLRCSSWSLATRRLQRSTASASGMTRVHVRAPRRSSRRDSAPEYCRRPPRRLLSPLVRRPTPPPRAASARPSTRSNPQSTNCSDR